MLWGQLPCIVNGMKKAERDNPDDLSASERGRQDSSDGWMYRVAARPGVWKVGIISTRQALQAHGLKDRESSRPWQAPLTKWLDRLSRKPRPALSG